MGKSPYYGKDIAQWSKITEKLIKQHPLKEKEIVDTVLTSWNEIFKSNIGSLFIGKDIFPSPQIMSFFLHELVAHYLGKNHPGLYKVGKEKTEKDVHCITDPDLSVEIKASSHPNQIFANRSYAQPNSGRGQKDKNGYYITINFEKFDEADGARPEILLIRFGYLEHTDWVGQKAATGQQARLATDIYLHKLKVIYSKD